MTQAEFEACCCDTWHYAHFIDVSSITSRKGEYFYTSHYEYEGSGFHYPIVPNPLSDSHWAALYALVQAATPQDYHWTPYDVGVTYYCEGPDWPRPGDLTQSILKGNLITSEAVVGFSLDFDPATEEAHSIVMRLIYTHHGSAFEVEVLVDGSPIDSWLVDGDGSRDIEVATYYQTTIDFVIRPVADPAYPGSTGSPPIGLNYEAGLDVLYAQIKYKVRDK